MLFVHKLVQWVLAVLFSLIFLVGGCAVPVPEQEPSPVVETDVGEEPEQELKMQAVKVVTTIFPLADIIRQVGAEGVEVVNLLAAGASPHTYEPSVEQAKAVADADLVIFIGGGLDNWAVKLAEGVPQVRLLEIMPLVEDYHLDYDPLYLPHEEGHHHSHENKYCHTHAHDHNYGHDCDGHGCGHDDVCERGHYHSPHDPHIWLDPLLVRDVVAPLIQAELLSVNSAWQDLFQEKLSHFQLELTVLHEEIAAQVALFRQKRFISYHSAWNYFAHRYGLEEVAAVEVFPGKEPSARWMAELVKLAAKHEIKVLFAEPQLGGHIAEVIAREIGGEVLLLDPLGGVGLAGRDNYFDLLRYNTEVLARGME